MALTIDAAAFEARLGKLHASLRSGGLWGEANALAVVTGPSLDEIRYLKGIALHLWLFGYELPDTVLVLTHTKLHVIGSSKKVNLVATVKEAASAVGVEMVLYVKEKKDEDGSTQMCAALASVEKEAGKLVLGALAKDKAEGPFIEDSLSTSRIEGSMSLFAAYLSNFRSPIPEETWNKALVSKGVETLDVTSAVSELLAVKDEVEQSNSKKAAQFTSKVLKEFLVAQIENVIDNEKKVTHEKLAQKTEDVVMDPSKINSKLQPDMIDICYIPMIQSGGQYDLRPSAANTSSHLDYGTIMCSLGTRYRSYCSNVARTYLVDPSPSQQVAYKALLAAQDAAIGALVAGATMEAPMAAALASLKDSKQPDLAQKLMKNVGFGMGLEFRDSSSVLKMNNTSEVKTGMVFNVSVGLTNLDNPDVQDSKGRQYALCLADSVLVHSGGKPPEVLTSDVPKSFKDIAYFFNNETEENAKSTPKVQEKPPAAQSKIVDSKLRSEKDYDDERRRHKDEQAKLVALKNQETLERLTNAKKREGEGLGVRKANFCAYSAPELIPQSRELQVIVDKKAEAVKNVLQSTDGSDNAVIRIQFNVPGAAFGAAGYFPAIKHPDATFVQEVSYRSMDSRHATNVVQELKTLRRMVLQRENERAERASLVRQEPLVISKGRVYMLNDLHIKPPLQGGAKGSKITGQLEAHVNGFRYAVSMKVGQHIEIPYRNVKHAFFQPAVNARDQCITLIHFTLHDPMMIGKKKTKDVQFYVTVIDAVESLDQNRRSMYDPDEMEEEERERERRNAINHKFQSFVKRVQELWERDFNDLELEFDIPFRELGFSGVPFKSQSFLMPTVNALVELLEWPFFVVSLNDVEIVNLERVIFGVKSFDMAIVFKDFNRPVHRIDSIPVNTIDKVKEWLNSVNIKYYESKVNINWAPVQKSILADPEKFVEDGGWEFLNMDKSDSEDEEEEEDAYEPSDAEESDDESSEGSDSEDSDGSVVDSEDEDESGSDELGSDESEGMSDDELEAWAAKQDKEVDFSDDEDKGKRRGGRAPGGRPQQPSSKKHKR